jgi:NAD(P)-dependent dehydrogenase (short-subunit alcohol dehydrogenase family)
MALSGDICDEAFARDAMDKVMEAYGRIDILVNNAGGQMGTSPRLRDINEKQLSRTFGCNVFGTIWMCKHVSTPTRRDQNHFTAAVTDSISFAGPAPHGGRWRHHQPQQLRRLHWARGCVMSPRLSVDHSLPLADALSFSLLKT